MVQWGDRETEGWQTHAFCGRKSQSVSLPGACLFAPGTVPGRKSLRCIEAGAYSGRRKNGLTSARNYDKIKKGDALLGKRVREKRLIRGTTLFFNFWSPPNYIKFQIFLNAAENTSNYSRLPTLPHWRKFEFYKLFSDARKRAFLPFLRWGGRYHLKDVPLPKYLRKGESRLPRVSNTSTLRGNSLRRA